MLCAALRLRSEVHGDPVSRTGHPQYSVSELVASCTMRWAVCRLATRSLSKQKAEPLLADFRKRPHNEAGGCV